MSPFTYWLVAATLLILGFFTLFSVGIPLFLTGAAMMVAAGWRTRRDVLIPVLAAPWLFTATYILIGPLGCSHMGFGRPGTEEVRSTICSNVLGIDYRGGGEYQPPTEAILATSALVAIAGAIALGWALRRRASPA